jgi:hypothetical protein
MRYRNDIRRILKIRTRFCIIDSILSGKKYISNNFYMEVFGLRVSILILRKTERLTDTVHPI